MNQTTSPILNAVSPACLNASLYYVRDPLKYRIFSAVYILVFTVGILANILALYVFIKLTTKKTASIIIMINLSTSDLFFSLTLPIRIVYYLRGGEWDFGTVICRISTYAFYLNLYSSIFFLTALTIFRYVAVVHAIRTKRILTSKRAVIVAVAIWVFVASISSPVLFSSSEGNECRCFEMEKDSLVLDVFKTMNYVALVVGFILPFLIIIACNSWIIHHLRGGGLKRRDTLKNVRLSRKRSIALTVIVLSAFLFCFLPYHVQRTMYLHFKMDNKTDAWDNPMHTINILTMCLAVANSCINPLLYYFVAENFQSTLRNAWRTTPSSIHDILP